MESWTAHNTLYIYMHTCTQALHPKKHGHQWHAEICLLALSTRDVHTIRARLLKFVAQKECGALQFIAIG